MSLSKLPSGQVGTGRRQQSLFRLTSSRLSSDRPPSAYEFQGLLRRLSPNDLNDARSCLIPILEIPKNLCLLRTPVLAGRMYMLESLVKRPGSYEAADGTVRELNPVVRDELAKCRRWEASLTRAMRAARCGDVAIFMYEVSANANTLDQADHLGFDTCFWVMTGGSREIIDYVLASASLQRSRGRNLLHMMTYAAPETVKYVFSKLPAAGNDLLDLVKARDHYNEDDEWGVFYYTDSDCMDVEKQRWMAVKTDRNRDHHLWMTKRNPDKLREVVSVKFEENGEEVDERGRLEIQQALISCRSDKPDRTPLHRAAEAGNVALAEALLEGGADVNSRDCFGMTPLHTAAKCGHEEVAELLCSRGADLRLLDNTSSTALEVAVDNERLHIEQVVINTVFSYILLTFFIFSVYLCVTV